MKLRAVSEPQGKGFTARCLGCKQLIPAGTAKVADLDGEPFEAYYHTTCVPHPPGQLHISGRRWFQRGPGNTYHTVYIYRDGECIARLGPTYGYGDSCLQTAIDWLRQNGYPQAEYGTRYIREVLGASYDVSDVRRERDL